MEIERIIETAEEDRLVDKSALIRKNILHYISNAQSGHPGSSLSIVELLVTLYHKEMNIDPSKPKMDSRDRFILSKGHGVMALYCVLADKGYYSGKEIESFRQYGSLCQGHPEIGLPGIEACSGSLGQGLSIASGMALNSKIRHASYRVFVLMGDGEINEGQIWEAASFASKYKLDNLVGIVDRNRMQHDGFCDEIMPFDSIKDKFESFGWSVYSCDGHSYRSICATFKDIRLDESDKPKILVADTVKGKGVKAYENTLKSHSVFGNINEDVLSSLYVVRGGNND